MSVKVVTGRVVNWLKRGNPALAAMRATADGQNFRSTSRNMSWVLSLGRQRTCQVNNEAPRRATVVSSLQCTCAVGKLERHLSMDYVTDCG